MGIENETELKQWGVDMALDCIEQAVERVKAMQDVDAKREVFAQLASEIMDYTWPTGRGYVANQGQVGADDGRA